MITQQEAAAAIEKIAEEFKHLNYEELERFAISHGGFDNWQSRELLVGGETVYVNTMIGKLGRIHKRISVELILSAEDGILPADTPWPYFERFESGRLYLPRQATKWETALLKALPYASIPLLIAFVALAACVVYTFLNAW